MIYSLSGVLRLKSTAFAVVECGGVGFKCLTSLSTLRRLPEPGREVTLFTHLNVREDALDLFGFADEKELNCFKMLISVSGVGPKAALSVLSEATPEKFALYVASGDSKALTRAQGVGAKTAQRIILELKDKINGAQAAEGLAQPDIGIISASSAIEEAINALLVLGFSRSDAAAEAVKCDETLPAGEIIRQCLKNLSKQ